MHRYYWAAKAVTQLNQILMLNIEERINGSRGRADAADRRALPRPRRHARGGARRPLRRATRTPSCETFLVYQQTPGIKGLSARTLRALYNARNLMDASFRRDPANRATLHADPARAAAASTHALAADEPDLGAGPLPVGLPPHRRAACSTTCSTSTRSTSTS